MCNFVWYNRTAGVVSAEVKDSTVTVVGDRIDTIALTVKLRKQMGFAELSKVGAYDEMKEKEEKMRKDMAKQMSSPAYMYSPYPYSPYPHAYPVHDAYNNHHNDPSCSIM